MAQQNLGVVGGLGFSRADARFTDKTLALGVARNAVAGAHKPFSYRLKTDSFLISYYLLPMRYLFETILMCAVALLPSWAFASPAPPDKIDDYVETEMRKQHIPGLALGVYRDGQIVKAQGYGISNVELNVPVKPETIFQ